jgi:ribosomal-protein-alanine N-acetyltransferase
MFGFFSQARPSYFIKNLEREDLQECADIHAESFANPWGDGEIAVMLKKGAMKGMAARASAKARHPLQAFIIYRVAAQEAEVVTIASAKQRRRKGAARALMNAMIRQCLSDRLDEIFLEVDENNIAALRLYKSLGFRKVGERPGYYVSGNDNSASTAGRSNALIMRLDLKA